MAARARSQWKTLEKGGVEEDKACWKCLGLHTVAKTVQGGISDASIDEAQAAEVLGPEDILAVFCVLFVWAYFGCCPGDSRRNESHDL